MANVWCLLFGGGCLLCVDCDVEVIACCMCFLFGVRCSLFVVDCCVLCGVRCRCSLFVVRCVLLLLC